jgi:hypothetical protein
VAALLPRAQAQTYCGGQCKISEEKWYAFSLSKLVICSSRWLELWMHEMLKHSRVLVYCSDCRRVHKEIFELSGTKAQVVRQFNRMAIRVNQRLTRLFGT